MLFFAIKSNGQIHKTIETSDTLTAKLDTSSNALFRSMMLFNSKPTLSEVYRPKVIISKEYMDAIIEALKEHGYKLCKINE